jgi:acyl-ACP thioesterase
MYTTRYTLHGTEIDHTFHLKPMLTASVFHDTFARLSYELEVSALHLQPLGFSWVLSDMHLEFTGKRPFWRESYSLTVWVRRNQNVRIFTDFQAFDNQGAEFARGTSIWLLIDTNTRQPVMNNQVFSKFEVTKREAIPGFRFTSLSEGENTVASEKQKVNVSDLDFNLHLNSIRYLGGGIEALGSDFLLKNSVESVTVKYMKEILCNETITIEVGSHSRGFIHQMFNAAGDETCRFLSTWKPIL